MTTLKNFDPLLTAVEEKLGGYIDTAINDPMPGLASENREGETSPVWALKMRERAIVSAQSQWVEPLQVVVKHLIPDALFSVSGTYELTRITLARRCRGLGSELVLYW